MDRIRQLSLDLVKEAPTRPITPRSAERTPINADQVQREQMAAAAAGYIERFFDHPTSTRSLEKAQAALKEALEQ